MKILVTGARGQLGYDVIKTLEKCSIECLGVDIDDFDITNESDTRSFIKRYSPDGVIHCSAYTLVDKAEDDFDRCISVNVFGTRNIAKACNEINAKIMYISSDYVFDGTKNGPYCEDDIANPLSVYGKSKADAEKEIVTNSDKYFIVRTSWMFGNNGDNFVRAMLMLAKETDEVRVVNDQLGSPTYSNDLAIIICKMIRTEKYGIYHITNEGFCTWAQFATEVFKEVGYDTKVKPIPSEEYITKAIRPKNSRLSKKYLIRNGFNLLPHWKDALKRYLKEIEAK